MYVPLPETGRSFSCCLPIAAPDGKQEKGQFRRYTDHTVVAQLKQAVENNVECQFTLINYKKSGEVILEENSMGAIGNLTLHR